MKNVDELEFVIFCIENVAEKIKMNSKDVYDFFKKNDMLDGYIVPEYEVLHTQGKEYIIREIIEVMKERGADL